MIKAETIKNIYKCLEGLSTFAYPIDRNIEKRFQNLEARYKHKGVKEKCRWEMYVWGFRIDEGKVQSMMSSTSKTGEIWEYPSLGDFGINGLNYLIERTKSVQNKYLLARYNHILWESDFKHKKYAEASIKSYIDYIELIKDGNKEIFGLLECLINISNSSNSKITETNDYIYDLIEKGFIKNEDITQLGDYYLKNSKKKNCLKILKLIYEKGRNILLNTNIENFSVPYYCNSLIRIGKSLSLDFKIFYQKKGDYYFELGKKEKSWTRQDHFFNAIKAYSEIGEKEKTDNLYVLIEKSKENIKLGAYSHEYEGKEIQKIFQSIKIFSDRLTNLESYEIYDYLAVSNEYLPKASNYNLSNESSFLDFITTISYDINSNFQKGDKRESISAYWLHLTNFSIRHLSLIFQSGIRKGTINYSSLINYLYEKSWIGKEYSENDLGGNTFKYNLLETLAPALFDFFKLAEAEQKMAKFDNTGYVLCIDSLTLKIEGLIRHFAKLIDCPTIIINKGKDGTRERYIEEIIIHPNFKNYFSEEDLIFITFLLTKKGMNLRNNIAHSFFRYQNYSVSIMFLLIAILLRLGKFELIYKGNN